MYQSVKPERNSWYAQCGESICVCAGRDYVVPEDIKILAHRVWAHRMCYRRVT
ncbi:MAG: hypothetical protein ACLS9K_09260 [Lachnospira eligens]